jgi:hypothetical protein
MTCRDFDRAWNELMDGEVSGGGAKLAPGAAEVRPAQGDATMAQLERELREHAANCPACTLVNARYQGLRRAIGLWGPPPTPSARLADRVLAETRTPVPSAWAVYGPARRALPRTRVLIPILAGAMAASALLVFLIDRIVDPRGPNHAKVVRHSTPIERGQNDGGTSESVAGNSRTLNVALAEATAATWDLARSTSEPAARISRQMLDAATGPERNPSQPVSVTGPELIAATVSVPSLDSLTPDTAAAGAMLQQVGDRMATGVRPLSDTARHAFGFLLGPTLPKPEVPVNPPAQKGA